MLMQLEEQFRVDIPDYISSQPARFPIPHVGSVLDVMTRLFQVLSNTLNLQVSRHSSPTQDTTFY